MQKQLKNNKESRILNIGCGNGEIQDHLYQSGYRNIINNDISKVVINQMQAVKQKKGYKNMVYEVMDVRHMSYPDSSFEMVLDKSTIDALLCSDSPLISVAEMLKECYRVLKDNGIYLMISYGLPNNRVQHLAREHVNFNIEIVELSRECQENGGKLVHYVYVCRKRPMQKQMSEKEYHKFLVALKQVELEEY